jgi:lipopolysaccharide export system permease protein
MGAFIITALNMALSLWVIPQAQGDIIQFESQYIKSSQRVLYDENAYRQIDEGTFAYVRGYSPRAETVSFFALEKYDGSELVAKLEASSAKFDDEMGR